VEIKALSFPENQASSISAQAAFKNHFSINKETLINAELTS
jgi:hypothetical protein